MRITETARAQANFTPQSRATLDTATLDARVGRGTVAGGLNDQIRFRFDHKGAPSNWALVPDNELSARLLESKSGPLLEQKLRGVLRPLDAPFAKGLVNLQGIMMSDDEQGYGAGFVLEQKDAERLGTAQTASWPISEAYASGKVTANLAEAQAINGWVHLPPDTARNVLTSVGAYTPATTEYAARSAKLASKGIGEVLGHELQHRVSEANFAHPDMLSVNWMEEGIATLLAMRGNAARANTSGWDTSAASHAGHVAAPDHVDVGWKPWQRDWSIYQKLGGQDTVQTNYVDSVGTLQHLVKLAGVDRRTKVGQATMFDLLQGVPVKDVPRTLAAAIIEHNDIPRNVATDALLTGVIIRSNSKDGIKLVDDLVAALRTK